MSLINDALKKAQKQRTGESTPLAAMPGVGGESAARIAKRAKPVGFNSQLIRLGLGAGAVLVLIFGGWFVMRSKPAPSAVSGQQSAVPQPTPAAPTTAPGSVLPAPGSQPPTPTATPSPSGVGGFVLPIVTPPPPTPEPVVVKKSETKSVPSSPAAQRPDEPTMAQRAPAQPALPLAKLEPKAITYIENLHIAGIRASAADSKVLMNDRVYRMGDIVEHEMNLKLIGITANSLTFEDERGSRYTRQF